jgi:hypothetical protein
MRGHKDFNFPAFFAAAEKLRAEGHIVFNPAERDLSEWGAERLKSETGSEQEVANKLGFKQGLDLARNCFLADTHWICTESEAIALLPGWRESKGAFAEYALHVAIGLLVIEL